MSSPYTTIVASKAPAAIGPYVHATKHNGVIYASGSIPLVPETMKVIEGGITEQAGQMFKNVAAVLEASSSSPKSVLKTTVFLKTMDDFAVFNKLYAEFFGESKPSRSCVAAAKLPLDVLCEMEFIAVEEK
ncbi:2-iminobutanoate/2-iminopropanoate deaminase, partial [Tremellales sp. Uapishka_1]